MTDRQTDSQTETEKQSESQSDSQKPSQTSRETVKQKSDTQSDRLPDTASGRYLVHISTSNVTISYLHLTVIQPQKLVSFLVFQVHDVKHRLHSLQQQ